MNETVTVSDASELAGYDEDFFLWTQQQAALLRARNDLGADWENLAEEIESLGKGLRRELNSRLAVLFMHLLKWQVQTEFRSPSWRATINVQRRDIEELLSESPSLRRELGDIAPEAYAKARLKAQSETGLPARRFSEQLPFPLADVLAEGWLPDGD